MDQENKTKRALKNNEQIKLNLYTCITRHPQVVQSPISNYCLKVMFDDQTEPQLVTKLLLQVYVRELHNSLVSYINDGGLKDAGVKMLILLSVILNSVHCLHLN